MTRLDVAQPLDEQMASVLVDQTSLDADEAWEAVRALMPLIRTHGQLRYDDGRMAGHYFARRAIVQRLGLGDLETEGER